jgi:hypothetical protein
MELVPGNSLIAATPEEGRVLALLLARHSIHAMQPDLEVLKAGCPKYSTDPEVLIAASPGRGNRIRDHRGGITTGGAELFQKPVDLGSAALITATRPPPPNSA